MKRIRHHVPSHRGAWVDAYDQAAIETGRVVGAKAREVYGNGTGHLISHDRGLRAAVAETSALLEATAFVRTRRGLAVPDMQLHVVVSPGSEKDLRNFGVSDEGLRYFEADPDQHGFVILPTLLHPAVAGSISLADGGTFTKPLIEPKYLQHQDDIASYLAGIKLALRLAKSPALSQWTDGRLRAWRLAVTGLRR